MSEKLLIPVSIIIAALLIGGGIYFASTDTKSVNNELTKKEETDKEIKKVDPMTEHIEGSKDAEIFIVEYSDLECPYCKRYNDTASSKLIKKYKDGGKVAFIFRHFPLSSIHPSSFGEAVATECAAKLGGEEKFFKYKDKIFSLTSSDGKFDNSKLPEIAESIGLDKAEFSACLEDNEVSKKVKDSYDEAIKAGLRGTPTIFAQLKTGETFPIPADYETIDTSLSAFLKELEK
jgi:protein-disulfide isomerase